MRPHVTSLLRCNRLGVSCLTRLLIPIPERTPRRKKMKKLLILLLHQKKMKKLLILLLLVPVLGWAQSPFDGTWKIDLGKTKLPKKPDVLLLQNGMFECKTCAPPINVKADGHLQKISGDP